jgi:cytochrome c biogenesis protein
MVEYALLARGEDHRLPAEGDAVAKLLADRWLVPRGTPEENSTQDAAASTAVGTGQSHHNAKDT